MKQDDKLDVTLIREKPDNLNDSIKANRKHCSVCRDLLTHMSRFFDMIESGRRFQESDWLTVDEIASELKVSKSIVYRLIRKGELEAVDLVENKGKIVRKGHYRITRSSLNQFLESKKVRSLPTQITHPARSRRLPKVKNHLGL